MVVWLLLLLLLHDLATCRTCPSMTGLSPFQYACNSSSLPQQQQQRLLLLYIEPLFFSHVWLLFFNVVVYL